MLHVLVGTTALCYQAIDLVLASHLGCPSDAICRVRQLVHILLHFTSGSLVSHAQKTREMASGSPIATSWVKLLTMADTMQNGHGQQQLRLLSAAVMAMGANVKFAASVHACSGKTFRQ